MNHLVGSVGISPQSAIICGAPSISSRKSIRRFQHVPKETHIAARNAQGDEFLYHENTYPPANVVEFFERYHKGAARELLEMAKTDQRNSFTIANRSSRDKTLRIIAGTLLTALFIICGTFLMYTGHWATGGTSIIISLLSLITIIASGEQSKGK